MAEEGCLTDAKFYNLDVENLLTTDSFIVNNSIYQDLTVTNNTILTNDLNVNGETLVVNSQNNTVGIGTSTNLSHKLNVNGTTNITGNTNIGGTLNVTGNISGNVTGTVSDISNHDTDALSEGTTKLYHTDSRSRSAISVTDNGGDGSLSYESSTGVITYTGPSATETRAHFSGGTGVTITDQGEVAIGQSVGTTDNVIFNNITSNDMNIQGNLIINGTTTTIDSVNTTIHDNLIELNSGLSSSTENIYDTGILINRGSSESAFIGWDETNDRFTLGTGNISNTSTGTLTITKKDLSINRLLGNVTGDITGTVSDISNHNTDALSEGTTNLYHTDSRSRSAISVTDSGGDGSLSYESSTGVITYTGPSATETRAHFSGGTGVTITDQGVVEIGQSVGTTDNVIFDEVYATITNSNQSNITSLGTLTSLSVDNLNMDGNTLSSTNTNGDIIISPNGTGIIEMKDDVLLNNLRISNNDSIILAGAGGNAIFTASASSQHNSVISPDKLHDNSLNSIDTWASSSSNNSLEQNGYVWIAYNFEEPVAIDKYYMWARVNLSQSPKNWELRASINEQTYDLTNSSTYTVLDTKTLNGLTESDDWDTSYSGTVALDNIDIANSYSFSNDNNYKYYVLHITGNYDDSAVGLLEWALEGKIDHTISNNNNGLTFKTLGKNRLTITDNGSININNDNPSIILAGAGGGADFTSYASSEHSSPYYTSVQLHDNNLEWNVGSWSTTTNSSNPDSLDTAGYVSIAYEFEEPVAINKYYMWATSQTGRTPKEWELRASVDKLSYDLTDSSTYTVLNTQSLTGTEANDWDTNYSGTVALDNINIANSYSFSNNNNFKYYVLHITAIYSGTPVALAEWALEGKIEYSIETTGGLNLKTLGKNRLTINDDGFVGIGTDNPTEILDIYGENPHLKINSGADKLSTISFGEASTSRGRIEFDGSGAVLKIGTFLGSTFYNAINIKRGQNNVGIGTDNPNTLLELSGNEPYLTLKNTTNENTDGGAETKIIFNDHTNTSLAQIQASHDGTLGDTKGDLIFSTNDGESINEALRIDSSGNIGINKTDPSYKLHLYGNSYFDGDVTISGTATLTSPTLAGAGGGADFTAYGIYDDDYITTETAVDTGTFKTDHPISNLFDNNINARGCIINNNNTFPVSFAINFNTSQILTKYYLWPRATSSDNDVEAPSSWQLRASISKELYDSGTYTILDSRSGLNAGDWNQDIDYNEFGTEQASDNISKSNSYSFTNNTYYKYYVLHITDNCGQTQRVSLGEWALEGKIDYSIETTGGLNFKTLGKNRLTITDNGNLRLPGTDELTDIMINGDTRIEKIGAGGGLPGGFIAENPGNAANNHIRGVAPPLGQSAVFVATDFQGDCRINGLTSTLFDNISNNLALFDINDDMTRGPTPERPYVLDIWIDVPKVITEYAIYLPPSTSSHLPYGKDWEFQVYNPDTLSWNTLDTVNDFSGTHQNTIPSSQTTGYYNASVSTSILSRGFRLKFTEATTNIYNQTYIQFGEISMSFTSTNLYLDGSVDIAGNTNIDARLNVNGATNINNTTSSSNTTTGALIVDGGVGIAGNTNIGGTLDVNGTTNITGNTNIGGTLNVTGNISGNVTGTVSDISNHDTDALSEGTTKLYHTDSRSREAISVTDSGGDGSLAYNNTNGVITYTGPSATETRAHFSGGTGVTITDQGVVEIGQSVGTTDNVIFDNVFSNNIKNNLMDTNIWSIQSSGQISSNFGGYSLNQNASGENNMLINEIGPFGDYEYVWKCLASGNGGNDGGWNYDIDNVDYKFGYLSVVYFKVVNDTSGKFYHGCLQNGVLRTDGNTNTSTSSYRTDNPYFAEGTTIYNFEQNEWYVSIGIILPYKEDGYSPIPTTIGGIYRLSTGEKLSFTHNDYMMDNTTTTQRHRAYLFSSTSNLSELHFARPGFYKINGTEPTLTELLGGNTMDKSHIGDMGQSGHAGFSHVDNATTTNYAVLQNSLGDTFINAASGQDISFRINNLNKMKLDSSGNVGIGTDNPQSKLHINNGDLRLTDSTEQKPRIVFEEGTNDENIEMIYNGIGGGVGNYFAIRSNFSSWDNVGINYIPYSGNVGIGTTNPTERLHIYDTSPHLQIESASNQTSTLSLVESTYQGAGLQFNGNNARFFIGTFSGNSIMNKTLTIKRGSNKLGVNIGDTDPLAELHVGGSMYMSAATSFLTINPTNNGVASSVGGLKVESYWARESGFYLDHHGNNERWLIGRKYNGGSTDYNLNFMYSSNKDDSSTQNTIMTINSSGNVGIGTTGPSSKLHIHDETTSAGIELSAPYNKTIGFTDHDGIKNRFFIELNRAKEARLISTGPNMEFYNPYLIEFKTTPTGYTTFNSTKESNDSLSGALVVSGGVGIAGNTNIGGTLDVTGVTNIHNYTVSNKVVENNVDLLIEDDNSRLQLISNDSAGGGSYIALSNAPSTGDQKNWVFHHSGPTQDNKLGIYYKENNSLNTDSLYILSTTGLTLDTSGNVGIGTATPGSKLHIKQLQDSYLVNTGNVTSASYALTMESASGNDYWSIMVNTDTYSDLYFLYNGTAKGFIEDNVNPNTQMNFTGQHRCILNRNIDKNSVGLIVSSSGKYFNLDNSLNANINDSLPICNITNIDNDIKVFGVISNKEDTDNFRKYETGAFITPYEKANKNEQRVFINSLGEGAIWVCNKNGNLENGDYISSSSVIGYGMKQTLNENLLANHTVAKITCDCNFILNKIVKQKLKIINKNIDYDDNGNVQYEDDLDENGNQQMIYSLDTRFLLTDGTQITEEEYKTKLQAGEEVYIACFVGCTYHCG